RTRTPLLPRGADRPKVYTLDTYRMRTENTRPSAANSHSAAISSVPRSPRRWTWLALRKRKHLNAVEPHATANPGASRHGRVTPPRGADPHRRDDRFRRRRSPRSRLVHRSQQTIA